MRVGIATDHGGFALKEDLIAHLRAAGHEIVDFGAHALNPGEGRTVGASVAWNWSKRFLRPSSVKPIAICGVSARLRHWSRN